jgi:hypothetical protein
LWRRAPLYDPHTVTLRQALTHNRLPEKPASTCYQHPHQTTLSTTIERKFSASSGPFVRPFFGQFATHFGSDFRSDKTAIVKESSLLCAARTIVRFPVIVYRPPTSLRQSAKFAGTDGDTDKAFE